MTGSARTGLIGQQLTGLRRQLGCLRRRSMTSRAPDGPVVRRADVLDGEHAGRQARRRAPWLWRARARPDHAWCKPAKRVSTTRARPRPSALAPAEEAAMSCERG